MPRREFTKATRREIALRSGCVCERHLWRPGEHCTKPAKEFDHIVPDGLGGEPTVENAAHLCTACHKAKTGTEDVPRIADADLQRDRLVLGIKPKSQAIARRPKAPRVVADKLPIPPRRHDIYGRRV